ncbi:hypothetical protein A2U01_0080458, partial [Trifolium medium]|nr:hypothetical protein [Trifolium medium]
LHTHSKLANHREVQWQSAVTAIGKEAENMDNF